MPTPTISGGQRRWRLRGGQRRARLRADDAVRAAVCAAVPEVEEDPLGRLAWIARDVPEPAGTVNGTADGPVVREVAILAVVNVDDGFGAAMVAARIARAAGTGA